MYQIGTAYIDKRDNTQWTIADSGVYNNETLFTVIDRRGNYKRHYENKLNTIAEKFSSIKMVHTASLIGSQGLEVIFTVDSKYFSKVKRKGKIQDLIRSLDNSFLQSYYINEVIDLDRPSYSADKRASKGLKTIRLTYTTNYESMVKLKKLGIINSTYSSAVKPYNPTITFNSTTNSSSSQPKSQIETKNNMPHSETDSLVCVDFKSKNIVSFNYWMSYIKPVKRS